MVENLSGYSALPWGVRSSNASAPRVPSTRVLPHLFSTRAAKDETLASAILYSGWHMSRESELMDKLSRVLVKSCSCQASTEDIDTASGSLTERALSKSSWSKTGWNDVLALVMWFGGIISEQSTYKMTNEIQCLPVAPKPKKSKTTTSVWRLMLASNALNWASISRCMLSKRLVDTSLCFLSTRQTRMRAKCWFDEEENWRSPDSNITELGSLIQMQREEWTSN